MIFVNPKLGEEPIPIFPENPVKPSVSVRVENTGYMCSVCKNTAGNDVRGLMPKPFLSGLFLPPAVFCLRGLLPKKARYRDHFFRWRMQKKAYFRNKRPSHGVSTGKVNLCKNM